MNEKEKEKINAQEAIKEFHNLFPTPEEWKNIEDTARLIVDTDYFNEGIEQTKLKVYVAQQLGIDYVTAMNDIDVIVVRGKKKFTGAATLLMFLILREFPSCVKKQGWGGKGDEFGYYMVVQRPSQNAVGFKWTIGDAKRAGLISKDNWQKYPKDMLRSRCVSQMARTVFPDVVKGVKYTPEDFTQEFNPAEWKDVEFTPADLEAKTIQEKKELYEVRDIDGENEEEDYY